MLISKFGFFISVLVFPFVSKTVLRFLGDHGSVHLIIK